MDLQQVLILHKGFLKGAPNGVRADLFCVDLRDADLSCVDLRDADLSCANLSYTNLSYANLRNTDLRNTILRDTDLRSADLRDADLRGVDLRGVDLRGADLIRADLSDTDLRGIDLRGADLRGTCLDPKNEPNGEVDRFQTDGEFIIGYRTQQSTHCGNTIYKEGKTYEAPVFSTSNTECHPGLYLDPTIEKVRRFQLDYNYSPGNIVKVWAKKEETHKAGNKWRTKKFYKVENACGPV